MAETRTVEEIRSDIQRQLDDICEYLCSRGDTMQLREEVRENARRHLHALNARGWCVIKREGQQNV